jgi:hypothetical protein
MVEKVPEAMSAGSRSSVFFTKDITVEGLLSIYSRISQGMTGSVGIKLHTGEPHGPNLLPIALIKGLQSQIPGSTIVECNVLYPGPRQETTSHREVIATNGFDFRPVDILDEEGDVSLPVPGRKGSSAKGRDDVPGDHLTKVAVGSHLLRYDSLLVYTHFKGHAMAGFGGALKNIGIGIASGRVGKKQVHGFDFNQPSVNFMNYIGPAFLERMTESGNAIIDHFKGHITYINVLKNMSVDCDCDGNGVPPKCEDIGILGSTDIVAIDKASLDLVDRLPAEQNHDLLERIESRSGRHQIEYMKTLGMGNTDYDLIQV